MARIIYSINGEGMGHATRSMALIEELRNKHDILIIAGSSRIYPYLKELHPKVVMYEGIRISYNQDKVDDYETLKKYFRWILKESPKSIKKIYRTFKKYNPDILLTDFEGTTSYIANILNIPVVCICNVHSITKLKNIIPKKYTKELLKAKIVVNTTFPKADYHLITTFFYNPVRRENVFLFPPILRKELLKLKPKSLDYILVYQTASTNKKIFDELKKTNYDYIVYGFDMEKKDENLTFRKFNNKEWLKDLENCKAVITNGGYSLISEAISLHKPILSVPIKGQFEQILNALHVKKLGYGEMYDNITSSNIEKFINNIQKYEKNLKNFKTEDNSRILKKIEEIIEKECS
ncbi:MAG: hypothetical protein KatS3mg002_0073 [Candidatus Woesearchaeota archaeon]|nr:MAG: hypothetical protein KatS3mg002_0073 [Candidatus Woesearchaeota archaeon]